MSDLMTLDYLASNSKEHKVVQCLRDGLTKFPRSLFARSKYYQKMFDKFEKDNQLTEDFRKNFSMFVSKVSDTNTDLHAIGYEDE